MEKKFTKGPWKIEVVREGAPIDILGAKGFTSDWVASVHTQFAGEETGHANARLIAAATEMYELLEGIMNFSETAKGTKNEIKDLLTRINNR